MFLFSLKAFVQHVFKPYHVKKVAEAYKLKLPKETPQSLSCDVSMLYNCFYVYIIYRINIHLQVLVVQLKAHKIKLKRIDIPDMSGIPVDICLDTGIGDMSSSKIPIQYTDFWYFAI